MSATEVDRVFGALSDPTRRAILEMVAERGPTTATEVAARMPITRQAASKHLSNLAAADMLHASRAGREVRYEMGGRGLDTGSRWLETVGDRWDRRLAALREHVRQ